MSAFKGWRVRLLVLAVLVSVMLVWEPWRGLAPQPRGLKLGVDIAGGSRVTLEMEVSHVTIDIPADNLDAAWAAIRSLLTEKLNTTVNLVEENWAKKQMVIEVGKSVTGPFVQNIIGGAGVVADVKKAVTASTQNDATSKLQARVDPYGMLGVRLRTLGDNSILFEATGLDNRTRELLTKQGRLEMFIDNELVLTGDDIESFDVAMPGTKYVAQIPIRFTRAGAEKFAIAASGKANRPITIYLDRPSDAILIFDDEIKPTGLVYDNYARMFHTTEGQVTYTLLVSAVGTSKENLSAETLEYLEAQSGVKLRVLLLGTTEDFSPTVIQGIREYKIENIPRLSGESVDGWILRACGLISFSPLSPGLAEGIVSEELAIPIVDEAGAAYQKAKDYQAILSNRLPAEMSIVSETGMGARLGAGFMREALLAGTIALAGVVLLAYFRYRRWKICLAIAGFTLCEATITLGVMSAFRLTVNLPELCGLLVVVFTGLNHQLIVTDEMLRGRPPEAKVSLGWRVSRVLALVYTSIFVMLAAMVAIGLLGFGALRGLAVVAIAGTIPALLLTRPIYARVIDAILTG